MFDMSELTSEQKAAAAHCGGNLLIVAGAGTGKTTTLTARLAYLIGTGVPPERILMLTFSRRAAAELLHRAEQLAGDRTARAWGGTFHAIANRLLRRHGRILGLEPSFTLLDQADTADMLALVRKDPGTEGGSESPGSAFRRRARKQTLATILSRCVNTGTPLSQVLRTHYPWCAEEREEIKLAFAAYVARKRAESVLDYDDLLLCWGALLRTPDVAVILQRQFDHILVDEYQDTNPLQADLLHGMAGGGACITAVGDDAQAIYSFRAASHRNIMEFPTRFNASIVTLERNHRSTPALLCSTNALIAEASHRHPKRLWSKRDDKGLPALVRCDDEADQARQVCVRILQHHERGTSLMAQAVLVRAAHHSDLLELELTARKVPFVKYGGLRFLESAHVKDLVCLLRLVENPKDELAWFRVLQLVESIGPAGARRLTAALHACAAPLAAISDGLAGASKEAAEQCRVLGLTLQEAASPVVSPCEAIERVRVWLDPKLKGRYQNVTARLADLDQLMRAAQRTSSLRQFLADLALDPPSSTSDLAGPPHLDEDYLTISTIHSAKGCEWDVVHVIHATDGYIPSDLATGDAEMIEEERRLLYVAMTRARDHLYIYAPLRYHFRPRARDDSHGLGQLTRFLTPAVLATLQDISGGRSAQEEPAGRPAAVAGMAAVDRFVESLWD
ncbi:MAG: ATP-dependent helicase [Actinomycetota bacterium]